MSDVALGLLFALAKMRDHLPPPSPSASKRIADTAWRIQERGAPSPRAYQRLMAAWMRRVQAAILRAMMGDLAADAAAEEEDEAARLRRLARIATALRALRLPPPPTPPQIAAVNAPAARQGIRTSRRQLLQLGLPREVMEVRLQIPTGAEDLLVGIDIAPTAQDRAILTRWSREGTDLIRTVGQDLVAGLDEQVVEFARSGRPLSELSKVVQERLGIADRHADFIARDQVAKLNSALTESTQRAAGVTRYRWRSSTDQRVRPMHHALDGSIFSWGDPPVTNEKGDRNNPGEDYQCFIAGTMVSGVFVAGVRAQYHGPTVTLETRGGLRLTVTANHPVLTPRGFVPAQSLRKGDHVLRHGFRVDGAVVDEHPDHAPAEVVQVFGLLSMMARVPGVVERPDDFHGDGAFMEPDVDVVAADRLLLGERNAAGSEGVGDLALALADAGAGQLVADGEVRSVGVRVGAPSNGVVGPAGLAFGATRRCLDALPLVRLSLGAPADSEPVVEQEAVDPGALDPDARGDLQHGHALGVPLQNVAGLGIGQGGRLVARTNLPLTSSALDGLVQGLPVDPETDSDGAYGLASVVTLEDLVEVHLDPHFSGHVYSLQTTTGLVVANGIITSNCRCVAIPVIDEEAQPRTPKPLRPGLVKPSDVPF